MTIDSGFECSSCGKCCSQFGLFLRNNDPSKDGDMSKLNIDKHIPIYPEEADILEVLAESKKVPLRMLEHSIIPDKLSENILVTKFEIILDEENNYTCPFFDISTKKCKIYHARPLVCQAYPLSLKQIDAFNQEIYIDKQCPEIESLEELLKTADLNKIQEIFPSEYGMALKLFEREKKTALKLRELQISKKIDLEIQLELEDYERAVKDWNRLIIYVD